MKISRHKIKSLKSDNELCQCVLSKELREDSGFVQL